SCGPCSVNPIVLIELKPYFRWTVNIATSIMTMSGTLTTSTKAPTKIASPPRSSVNVDTHAVASGRGVPIWASSLAKPDGPRLSLAHPWAMNPKPMISRSDSGTHWPQRALFRSLNISTSVSRLLSRKNQRSFTLTRKQFLLERLFFSSDSAERPQLKQCVPCVIAPPAFNAAATITASAISASVHPAALALLLWISIQYGHWVVSATATAISSCILARTTPSARAALSKASKPCQAAGASWPSVFSFFRLLMSYMAILLGRAVGLRCGLASDLLEDPLSRSMVIGPRLAAAMAWREGGQALGVEAGDQVRDGVAGAPPGGDDSSLIVVAARDGQEHGGAGDLDRGCGLGPTDPREFLALEFGERAERVLLATRHGGLQCDERP